MGIKYFTDLENYSLSTYQELLKNIELLPGRRLLAEKLDERFALLEKQGLKNLSQLAEALKSNQKIKQLAAAVGIPETYLVILKRELNRLLPKSVMLREFPGVSQAMIQQLKKKGILSTIQLLDHVDSSAKRKALAETISQPLSDVEEITRLTDLSRIWGVGPVFCRIFWETGCDTVRKVAKSNARELFDQLTQINKTKKYTKAKFTLKDVSLCINIAGRSPDSVDI